MFGNHSHFLILHLHQQFHNAAVSLLRQMLFLRKIVPGATDDSYGIEVAKLAGLPDSVITRAREILAELEAEGPQYVPVPQKQEDDQVSLLDLSANRVCDALKTIQVETLTPIEAMNQLYKLKKMLDE